MKGLRLILVLIGVAGFVASSASAQTMDARASTALKDLNTGGDIFTTERKDETASAFSAPEPPQTGLKAATIEDDAFLKLLSDEREAGVYDRVQSRPRIEIEPGDERLDAAKWAATLGPSVTGDLESGAERTCTFRDYGSVPPMMRMCDRFRNFSEPSCNIALEILDGEDVQDLSACAQYDEDPLCVPSEYTCVSGPETRVIDDEEVTRLCWDWQQDYFCHADGQFSDCTPYETIDGCREIEATCLGESPDGACAHESVVFECGNPDADVNRDCSSVEVCQGTVCDGIAIEPDTDFVEATTWLNIASEVAEDHNLLGLDCASDDVATIGDCPEADVRFFTGKRQTCKQKGILQDCCKGGGIASGLLGGCNQAEYEIQQGFIAGTVHYLGNWCSSSFLGICTGKKRAYCNFNSKIARVFQQEARVQFESGWAGAGSETCDGLTTEQMVAIDYETFDLSEIFPDMEGSATVSDPDAVEQRLLDRFASYSASLSGDLVSPQADPNFDEDNVVTITDPITGEISYLPDDPDADDLTYTAIPDEPRIGAGPVTLPESPELGVGEAIGAALEEGTSQ